jgi:hypothetical protein
MSAQMCERADAFKAEIEDARNGSMYARLAFRRIYGFCALSLQPTEETKSRMEATLTEAEWWALTEVLPKYSALQQ